MHFIALVQATNPYVMDDKAIDKFIREICKKQFSANHLHESWNRIRAREIKLFDFTIPESIEKEVIEYLSCYQGDKIRRLGKLLNNPVLRAIAKKTGLEPVELKEPKDKRHQPLPAYVVILGKIKDYYKGNLEML